VADVDADRARDVAVVVEDVDVDVLVDVGAPSARADQPDRSGPMARNAARVTGMSAVAPSAHHRIR